ncbi:Inner membrane protein ybaL [Bacteroidales bacterium Barb6]|nr:Inner membrane protein ybaL [Bacteroidales bacterium Barb6]
MTHLPNLVYDLALILITAGVVTILFKWLKQPVVLGYIVAGFLVGPHIHLLPSVIDGESIATWSEIGIIFLLFALGLEFRYKKLLEVGKPALIAAVINMGAMIGIGYAVGRLFGWSNMEGLFLGGMVSMASTTIIIKAFNDMNVQKHRFANIVFGILIMEDIAAILMMVLFSTIAVSQTFEGMQLLGSLSKLIFFIIIWFVTGIFVIPTVLKKIKSYLNDETLMIVSVGLCLGMVLFAHSVGFSAALGAFIMGSVLAETTEAKRIEHLALPLKNLFGAVFFVSVGMMIAPSQIAGHILPIVVLTTVVLLGRILFATAGVLASGESLKVSVQAGFSLAQIGEFSFIIAALGIQLGVIGEFIYPVIVAVSVITTFTTPYGIRYSEKVYDKVEKLLPAKWNRLLANRTESTTGSTDWSLLFKNLLMPVLIYFVLSVAIVILSKMYLVPFITSRIPTVWGAVLSAAMTISSMAPFLYGIIKVRPEVISFIFTYFKEYPSNKSRSRWKLFPLVIFPKIVCVALILLVLMPLFPEAKIILILVSVFVSIFIAVNPKYEFQSRRMETAFLNNLNEADAEGKE